MPRGSHSSSDTPPASAPAAVSQREAQALGTFLRNLAARVETDLAFAAQVRAALHESGLIAASEAPSSRAPTKRPSVRRVVPKSAAAAEQGKDAPPDPFVLLREHGEAGLRDALESCDLATLRAVIRAQRLDPARISSRWTTRERVIGLIVDQTRARANHGKAFSRV